MFNGLNGFLIPRKIDRQINEQINREVGKAIDEGEINVNLEVVDLTSVFSIGSDGVTYTYNLPSSGQWLILVNAELVTFSVFSLNGYGIISNGGSSTNVYGGHKIVSLNFFTWIRSAGVTIQSAQAIKLRSN